LSSTLISYDMNRCPSTTLSTGTTSLLTSGGRSDPATKRLFEMRASFCSDAALASNAFSNESKVTGCSYCKFAPIVVLLMLLLDHSQKLSHALHGRLAASPSIQNKRES